jgi:hypothetical protein
METTTTTVSQESFDAFATSQNLYNQVNIIAMAIIAGCILASLVMRWFHHG